MESKLIFVVLLTIYCVICGICADDETMPTEMTMGGHSAGSTSQTEVFSTDARAMSVGSTVADIATPKTETTMAEMKSEMPQGDQPAADEMPHSTEAPVTFFTIPKLEDLPPLTPAEQPKETPTRKPILSISTTPMSKKMNQEPAQDPDKNSAVKMTSFVTLLVTFAMIYF